MSTSSYAAGAVMQDNEWLKRESKSLNFSLSNGNLSYEVEHEMKTKKIFVDGLLQRRGT